MQWSHVACTDRSRNTFVVAKPSAYVTVAIACNPIRYSRVYILITALSVALYCNTWSAAFAFDDNFAVIGGGDGTPNPHAFHAANTVMHAVASCLFFRVALAAAAAKHALLPQQAEHPNARTSTPLSKRCNTESLVAALLFTAHPIHTEAVAGIVGHAELLGAALGFAALLTYISAANQPLRRQHDLQLAAAVGLLWLAALAKEIGITVAAAMVLWDVYLLPWPNRGGRTLPQRALQLANHKKVHRLVVMCCTVVAYARLRSWLAGDHLVRIYRKVENPIPFAEPWTANLTTGYLHAKYFHLLLVPIWLSADWSYACIPYVKTLWDPRNLATAAVYMTVLWGFATCRPLATAACAVLHGTTQKQGRLSKDSNAVLREHREHGQHTEHAQQAKRRLIAGLTSDRTTAAPQPADSPAFGLQQTNRTADVEHREAVWVMVVMAGLMLGPFLPASNLLFYVGTFIGERLLYMPSAGFCLLLSHFIVKFLDPSELCLVRSALQWLGLTLPDQAELNGRMQQTHAQGTGHSQASLGQSLLGEAAEGSHGQQPDRQQHQQHLDALQTVPKQPHTVPKQPHTVPKQLQTVPNQPHTVPMQPQTVPKQPQQGVQWKARQEQWRSWLGLGLVCVLLMGYTCRTVSRNWDWQDEETLFIAAQKVCLNSAKVRLNSGILERRHSNWSKALDHFRAARQIDETYCEPTYWIGATLLQEGRHLPQALQELEGAVSCKYVAANAVNALQQVYQVVGNTSPHEKEAAQQAWAKILLKPELRRAAEACQLLEQTALDKVKLNGTYQQARGLVQPCLRHLEQEIAMHGSHGNATSLQRPNSDLPLAVSYSSSSLQHIKSCGTARLKILKAMSSHSTSSAQVWKAVHEYIKSHMPACRSQDHQGTAGSAVSAAHLQLIHEVQKADAADPWYQYEWGEIMLQQGRLREAVLHLQVAATLFASHIDKEPWSKASLVVHQEDLSKLAIEALHRATQAVPTVACASLNQECEVHHRMNTVMPSAAHALNLQACLQTYRTGCQEAV